MIDIRLVRENPDLVKASTSARGDDPALVDTILALDGLWREKQAEYEKARREQKTVSDRGLARAVSASVKQLKADADSYLRDRDTTLTRVGNIVDERVPTGGAEDFVVLDVRGVKRDRRGLFTHDEVANRLQLVDTVRASKTSGSRFYFLRDGAVHLERALISYGLDVAYRNRFIPMSAPSMVNPATMRGAGFLDQHADEVYTVDNGLYLTGTAEVAMAGYHQGEVVDVSRPVRYAAVSPCFRKEAGSAGKDTKGVIRVHQFEKLEMFSVCDPAHAVTEHDRFVDLQCAVLTSLGLHFRVVDTASRELGSSAARKYDCEAWLPASQRWLELTSTSNCTDYQARRLNVRYRDRETGKLRPAATVNGTLATTRWIAAIVEQWQQVDDDGSLFVRIPPVLVPYCGFNEIPR